MAFAQRAAHAQTLSSSNASPAVINLPSGVNAGELLLMRISLGVDVTLTTPAGWTVLVTGSINGALGRLWCAYRFASGSEGSTVSITMSGTSHYAARVTRYTGAHASTPPEATTVATGNSTAPNSTSLTPSWGAEDTVYEAVESHENATAINTFPTNYSSGTTDQSGGSTSGIAVLGVAYRELNATSDDPGAFALATGRPWGAVTLGIRPGGGSALTKSLSDTVTASDAIGKSAAHPLADTIAATDALGKAAAHPLADTVTASDAAAKGATLAKADTLTASDATAKATARPQADSLTVSDAISKAPGPRAADTLTATDAVTKAAGKAASDSLSASDALAKALGLAKSDTLTLSDLLALAEGFHLGLSDSLTVSDVLGRAWGAERSAADTLGLSDAFVKAIGPRPADTLTATDALSKALLLSITDVITASELIDRAWAAGLSLADALELVEAVETHQTAAEGTFDWFESVVSLSGAELEGAISMAGPQMDSDLNLTH